MADPYTNVFFSKDRTETIIEPVSGNQDSSGKSSLGILSRAEWMRGCPEGSKLSMVHDSELTNRRAELFIPTLQLSRIWSPYLPRRMRE